MRSILTVTTVAACGLVLTGCATTGYGDYASACERDYARNRERAISAGALLGAAVGAAVAGEGNREQGAVIGAAAGALLTAADEQVVREGVPPSEVTDATPPAPEAMPTE